MDGDVVRITWWQRCWHGLVGLVRPELRTRTPLEVTQGRLLGELNQALEAARTEVGILQRELEQQRSVVRLRELEIQLLAEVIERDRRRVEAETAVATQQIAQATGLMQRSIVS